MVRWASARCAMLTRAPRAAFRLDLERDGIAYGSQGQVVGLHLDRNVDGLRPGANLSDASIWPLVGETRFTKQQAQSHNVEQRVFAVVRMHR